MQPNRKRTIKECNLKGKRVLIRVDFNVPIQNGQVHSPLRIIAALPTIQYAIDSGAKAVILASHLGRPNGEYMSEFSLRPVARKLQELLERPVTFLNDCVGEDVVKYCQNANNGIQCTNNI